MMKMKNVYCPWSGSVCDCDKFPFPVDNLIPQKCENLILEGIIALVPLRKVSDNAKATYKQWLVDEAVRIKAEKAAKKTKKIS